MTPCECGCGQLIDPLVDPCPWFKGQACQQLFMSTPADCKRPDLWRANQRQMLVWQYNLPVWSFRMATGFDCVFANARWTNGQGMPLRVMRKLWKRDWDNSWTAESVAEYLTYERPRDPWDVDLRNFYERVDEHGMAMANRARLERWYA